MIVETIVVNHFQVNNYLVICEKTKEAALIDAGGEINKVMQVAKKHNANIKYVLNTHGHVDHVAGIYDLKEKTGAKVFLHKDDEFLLGYYQNHAEIYGFQKEKVPTVDEFIKEDGFEIKVGELVVKTIHTPGHSKGSVCYLVDNKMFAGDTLFCESVGRTDLPSGSYEELKASIENKLFILSDDIKVYPGHGASTSIGHEKKYNPFFGKSGLM